MRRTNERARPIIERLIEEGPWIFTPDEATSFARWAVMLTMTWEFADVSSLFTPQAERRALRRSLGPPDGWGVFIAPYDGTAWKEMINHRTLARLTTGNHITRQAGSQTNVFTLGQVAVNTVSGELLRIISPDRYAEYFGVQVIWPIMPATLVPTVGDEALNRLATVGAATDLFVAAPAKIPIF